MLGLRDDRRDGQDEESKGIVEGGKAGSGIRLRGWYGMKRGWRKKEVDKVMKGWWAEEASPPNLTRLIHYTASYAG